MIHVSESASTRTFANLLVRNTGSGVIVGSGTTDFRNVNVLLAANVQALKCTHTHTHLHTFAHTASVLALFVEPMSAVSH